MPLLFIFKADISLIDLKLEASSFPYSETPRSLATIARQIGW